MKKFISPTGSNEVWITQTYHTTSGNTAIDISNLPVGSPIYAIASGTIGTVSPTAGSYLTIRVDNSPLTLFYVHIYNFTVKAGQKVKVGDKIGEIAPKTVNGNYPPHLHLGLQVGYGIMDYFDRGIIFKAGFTWGSKQNLEIRNAWFKGGSDLDWGLFKDLSYESNTTMGFKKGDIVIITGVQNIRQAPAGKVTGDSVVGQLGIIHDNPRQAIVDGVNYTWYDIHIINGGSGWFADVGKFRLATPEEINPTPTPVPPVPTPTPTPPIENWEERYNEELKKNKGLVEDVRALEKEVKKLGLEIEQKEVEYRELREECDGLEEKNKMLEEERLLLQEKQEAELKDYRRWSWLVNILNTICPRK